MKAVVSAIEDRYLPAAALSVLLHLVLIGFLVFNFNMFWQSDKPVVMAKVIDAVVVDSGILEEVENDKQREANRRRQQLEQQRREQEALRVAEKQRQLEKQKQAAEQKRLEAERQAEAARQAAEQQRLEQERKAEAERQQRLEAERKAEAERQQRLEAERKAEQERQQRLAEEKRLLEEAKKAEWERLRKQEEEALAQARSAELANNKALYIQAITQKVERNWISPGSARPGDTCKVSVQQIPGGEVISVKIVSCDADAAFERSVENAVYKASPLPDPPDPRLFERNINFIFKPME